jgi:hypothetical protein
MTPTSIVHDAFSRKLGNPGDTQLWATSRFAAFEKNNCVGRMLTWLSLYDYGQMVWNHSPGALHAMLDAGQEISADYYDGSKGNKPMSVFNSWKDVFDLAPHAYQDILQRSLPISMYWNLNQIAVGDSDVTMFLNGKASLRDKTIYAAMCCLMSEGRLTDEVLSGRQFALQRAIQSDLPGVRAVVEKMEMHDIQGESTLSAFSHPILEEVMTVAKTITKVSERPINLPIVNSLRELQASSFSIRPDEDWVRFLQRTPWGQYIYAKGIKPYGDLYGIPHEDLAGEAVRAVVEGYNFFVPVTMAQYSARDATTKEKVRKAYEDKAAGGIQLGLGMDGFDKVDVDIDDKSKQYTHFVCPAPAGSIEAQMKYRLGEEVDRIKSGGFKNSFQDNTDAMNLRKEAIKLHKTEPDLDWSVCVETALKVMNAERLTTGRDSARDEVEGLIPSLLFSANPSFTSTRQREVFERALALHQRDTKQPPTAQQWADAKDAAGVALLSESADYSLNGKLVTYVKDGNPTMTSLDAPTSIGGSRTGHEMLGGEDAYDANLDDLEPKGRDDMISQISTGCRYEFGFPDEPEGVPRGRILSSIEKEAKRLGDTPMQEFMQSITRDFKTYPTHEQVESMLTILDENYKAGSHQAVGYIRRGTTAIRTALDIDRAPGEQQLVETGATKDIAEEAGQGRTIDVRYLKALKASAEVLVKTGASMGVLQKVQKTI